MTGDPILGNPYISKKEEITLADGKKFQATKFSVNCEIGYLKQAVDDGVRFDVIFLMDNTQVHQVTAKSTQTIVPLDEDHLAGHIGKTVSNSERFFIRV